MSFTYTPRGFVKKALVAKLKQTPSRIEVPVGRTECWWNVATFLTSAAGQLNQAGWANSYTVGSFQWKTVLFD